jgi:ABC-type branched-subunit amino acid transport system ATPase component
MTATALLETKGLTMRFGGVVAVDHVDFTLQEVELRCVIGPNGAGKSTFFKCLTGQLRPTAGQVLFRGAPVGRIGTHAIARLGVGIKTQVPNVFDGLTARDNVWTAATKVAPGRIAERRTDEAMERVGISGIADRIVGQLAHGQRQLVELAMVIAPEPDLILLDEPAAGMTDEEVDRLVDLIAELNQRHALVVVEHDMQFIRRIAKTVTVFHQGAVLIEGNVADILTNDQVRDVYLGKQAASSPPLRGVRNLASGYQKIPIILGVNFEVADGEFVGILGHNGMGKTTLLKTVVGQLPATAGSIRFGGAEIARAPSYRRARLGLGYVPQGRQIFPGLSVLDNMRMGAASAGLGDDVLDRVIDSLPRLKPILGRAGGVLSGGEQQILALARCLCGQPRLILLDEPTEGIQPSIIEEIIEILLGLKKRSGLTVVLVEQNLDFIRRLSDRVLIIQKGRITGEVPPDHLHDDALVAEFVGMSAH